MAAAKTTVTVAEGCVVYVDGESCAAGQQIKVSATEAKQLVEQGVAVKS